MFISTRTATIIIAASDSYHKSRITADLVCDGTADDVEIQAAVDLLPDNGGSIYLSEGIFTLSAQITRDIDNITIIGSGRGTRINLDASTAVISAGSQAGWSIYRINTDEGGVDISSATQSIAQYWKDDSWSDSGVGGASQSATFVVAASDASANMIASADYVCDGTADDVQIQAAIDALPAGGGKVMLSEGAFACASGFQLPTKPLVIEGASPAQGSGSLSGATVLTFTFGGTEDCFEFAAMGDKRQAIRNMVITGDGSNTRYGSYFPNNTNAANKVGGNHSDFGLVENVVVRDMATAGVFFDAAGASQCTLRQVYTYECPIGFDVDGADHLLDYCSSALSSLGSAGKHGFVLRSGQHTLIKPFAYKHDIGILGTGQSSGVTIMGGVGEACNVALELGVDGSNNCYAWSVNGFNAVSNVHATKSAIRLMFADGCVLTSCRVESNTSGKSLLLDWNAVNCTIVGGRLQDGTPVEADNGTGSRFINVKDYVTENSGTATLVNGQTSIAVTHGLAVTPGIGDVMVTPVESWGNATKFWISAYSSTTFTITVDQDPGADVDFAWKAVVL